MQTGELTANPRRTRPPLLPLGAALVAVVLWASAFVAIRYVGRELSAGALSLGRLLIAGAVLGVVVGLTRRRARAATAIAGGPATGWPDLRSWPRLLVCGVVWFGVYNLALSESERRIDAGTAAMLVNLGPILIALLAGLLLGEGFPRRVFLGSAVAFGGAVIIGVATSPSGAADRWGVALALVAAAAYAIGVIAQKPLVAQVSALRVTWLACLIGALTCAPAGPALVRELAAAGPSTIGWLVYLGVMPTAVAFTAWAYALARTSAGRLGSATYLVPPLTILMGWMLLGEVPAALAILGGTICLAGVYLSQRHRPA